MKLAKKMLACAMALAMVAALALTAFAAAPAIEMTATKAVVGEKVTVNVAGKDTVGLKSADLVFTFDTTAFKYESVKKAYPDFDLATGGNPEKTPNEVTFSFAYLEKATESNAFCTIEFTALKAGTYEIKGTATSWEGTEKPADVTLKITVEEKATDAPETTTAKVVVNDPTTKEVLPQAGEAGVAAIAGVMAIAAVAFVATRKKDEE